MIYEDLSALNFSLAAWFYWSVIRPRERDAERLRDWYGRQP